MSLGSILALVTDSSVPARPTGFSVGIGTATIVATILTIALIVRGFYSARKKIIELLQSNDTFRATAYTFEPLGAFCAGVLATSADLYKLATWAAPQLFHLVALQATIALVGASIGIKVTAALAKEKEKEKIGKLEAQHAEDQAQLSDFRHSKDRSIRIYHQIREVLSEKMERLRAALRKPRLTTEEFLLALNPQEQLQFIIAMIHKFFEAQLDPGRRLRVAVYMREPPDSPVLTAAFSFDGKSADCIKEDNTPFMRLDEVEGSRSLIVQTYRAHGRLQVVASAPDAVKEGTFHYFRPDQTESLKSLVAYKHVWERDSENGRKDALIVCLDTDQEGFFGRFQRDELSEFFLEMMKRFEYEHASLAALAMLQQNQKP